jgi:hypothetical protein
MAVLLFTRSLFDCTLMGCDEGLCRGQYCAYNHRRFFLTNVDEALDGSFNLRIRKQYNLLAGRKFAP